MDQFVIMTTVRRDDVVIRDIIHPQRGKSGQILDLLVVAAQKVVDLVFAEDIIFPGCKSEEFRHCGDKPFQLHHTVWIERVRIRYEENKMFAPDPLPAARIVIRRRDKEILPKENKILKENTFFLEFKAGCHSAIIFRQGRMVIRGTKEKNTGLYLYRKFIGS